MFNKNNRNGKILNILLGLIALFIIIFIIAWVVNKSSNKANYDGEFKASLNNMQEVAKEYFANELPEEIGDSTLITLEEMYRQNLVDEITYGTTTCNDQESYIQITKINATEYKVKSNLVCGDKLDNIVEKIETKTIIEEETEDNTNEEKDEDGNINIEEGTNKEEEKDSNTGCVGLVCKFEEVPTTCETKYEYEYVKRTVNCKDGYSYQNGLCVKENTVIINPTPVYSKEQLIVEDALVNKGNSYKQYTDPIVSGGESYSYCSNGTLIGGYCYTYKNKVTSYGTYCPTGYTKVGNYCYKYADVITNSSSYCPNGYEQKNGACYKYTDLITSSTETYSCPNGYEKVGSGKDTKCLKTVSAVKKYTEWGNPDGIYSTTTKETVYEYELEKKVLVGSNTVLGTTVYSYSIYSRKAYNYCAQGELNGNKCYIYSNATVKTNSSSYCPSDYTKDGNTCYNKTSLTTTSTNTCPSGYTKDGNTCYIKKSLNISVNTTCPSGYKDNGSNCYKRTLAKTATTEKTYTCPSGYTSKGSGKNLECYKTYFSQDTYYCENSKATLKEDKCYLTIKAEQIGSSCPNGYDKTGNTCVKVTVETENPTWTNGEVIYSPLTSLEGYQKTGVAKFVTTCTPIKHYK